MLDPVVTFWLGAAFAFVFGSLIGSFLNVVIYRVPEGLSVVSPPSRCPACESPVRWYDNIPILSWLILRGRCRDCGIEISPRYALVELLTAVLALGAWYHAGGALLHLEVIPPAYPWAALLTVFGLRFVFICLLIVIAFVDLDHLIIPHRFTLPGMVLGLASPWILQAVIGPIAYLRIWPPVTPMISLVGFLVGGLSVIAIFYLYYALRGIEGIGGGDVTLMAMIGAWLGWPAVIFVFFAGSLQGLIAAGIGMALGGSFVRDSADIFDEEDETAEGREKTDPDTQHDPASVEEADAEVYEGKAAIPFGPFLSLAALEFLLLGPFLPREFSLLTFYF